MWRRDLSSHMGKAQAVYRGLPVCDRQRVGHHDYQACRYVEAPVCPLASRQVPWAGL
jgi:hypothetical protein